MRRLLGWFLLLTGVALADPTQVQIFQLNNRPAAATVEVVRAMLSPTGTVFADERLNKLIVRDTPEALQRVSSTLEQIDQPAPQVKITVDFSGANPQSGYAAGVGVSAQGQTVIRDNQPPRTVVTGQGTVVANAYDSQNTVNSHQYLMVMSGEKAHIVVGRNLAYVQPYWSYANGLGLIPPGIVFQTVSSGFAVEPVVIGDNIRVRITPYISYQSPNGPGQIEFAESATSVNLRSGDSMQISSASQSRKSSQSAFGLILGGSADNSTSSGSFWLSASILDYYRK